MQKTIYVRNQDIWESIKTMAGEKSISRYLLDLHEANVLSQQIVEDRATLSREQLEIVSEIPDNFTFFGGTRGQRKE